ncbi:hypothetical protein AYY19_03300 [Photobacterium aquimaris]|uniref:RNA polymerase sigma factor n=1 Tax=Photobacterium aquimaris TaxID=512643 RepID=UPI0007EF84E5|nr:RNA polymerase sigma factor [Photobacterium aquimaris]OBU16205.1 hypothetical protein AYY19_03300 [Photobacterium aquimaris]PSW02392.1 RNA polymerase sigma factor [Photobacterium aquimaris]
MNEYDNDHGKECHLISMFQSNEKERNEWFHLLMQPYLALLHNRCVYKIRDKTSAEDLVQEILIRVYKALPTYRHEALFKTWIFKITDNVCYSFLSCHYKYKTDIVTMTVLEYLTQVNNHNIDLEITFNQAMPALSKNEQEIIKLRFYKDFSLSEISHILQITISACKMRLYRALQSLSLLII